MDKKWSEKSILEKTLDIISAIALVVWVVFEVLKRTNGPEYAGIVTYISPGIICVCQAFSFWNVKRTVSYIGLAGAVCTVVGVILELS